MSAENKPVPAAILPKWPKLLEEPMPSPAPPAPCSDPRCAVCAWMQ